MELRTSIASEESKWIIRNYFQVVAYYKALADSKNLEIEKMINALEDTRLNWLADRKDLQSKISKLETEITQSADELKENVNQKLSDAAELDEIKRQLRDALEENERLKTENDLLKEQASSSTMIDVATAMPDIDQIADGTTRQYFQASIDGDQDDESFHSPLTTPVQQAPHRTDRKKRRSSTAFVRRSSSLPARNELSRSGSSDEGEDDDCYHTSIKRIKCSQNLHNADLNDAIGERCVSAMSGNMPLTDVSYDNRPHSFSKKRCFYRVSCTVCGVGIGFSSMFVKCSGCKCIFHEHCRLKAPLPCLSWVVPPKLIDGKGMRLRLGDFCPNERPMVPTLIAYCVHFLNRGNFPSDLYLNPGSEFEIEAIAKMFKAPMNNIKLDTFSKVSVAACIKKFLCEIRDPLIPSSYAKEFVQAATVGSLEAFPKLINDLPTAHMDALACLCRHWRVYIESVTYSHMSLDDFCGRIACTVFGVRDNNNVGALSHMTTVGQVVINAETAFRVLKNLLEFPVDFWTDLLNNVHSAESSRAHTPILRNPSGRSTVSMKTTSSCNNRYQCVNFEKAES